MRLVQRLIHSCASPPVAFKNFKTHTHVCKWGKPQRSTNTRDTTLFKCSAFLPSLFRELSLSYPYPPPPPPFLVLLGGLLMVGGGGGEIGSGVLSDFTIVTSDTTITPALAKRILVGQFDQDVYNLAARNGSRFRGINHK